MMQLTRQARLFLPRGKISSHSNRWSSLIHVEPLQPYFIFEITVGGNPGADSGYIVNIRQIDYWVESVIGTIEKPSEVEISDGWNWLSKMATQFHSQLISLVTKNTTDDRGDLDSLQLIRTQLNISPYLWLTVEAKKAHSQAPPPRTNPVAEISLPMNIQVWFTQQFEFSAAHRLHCEQWTEQKNQDVFGKCNHINGHGHNYLLDVTVQKTAGESDFASTDTLALESCVNQHVIEKLDHRFLNLDVDEFKEINPTVENISQLVFGWLEPRMPSGLKLAKVRVYETAKTWAEVGCQNHDSDG